MANTSPSSRRLCSTQCQAVMLRRRKPNGPKLKPYLFRGAFHCGECGCLITTETQKDLDYLRCTIRKRPCSQPYVRAEAVQGTDRGMPSGRVACPSPMPTGSLPKLKQNGLETLPLTRKSPKACGLKSHLLTVSWTGSCRPTLIRRSRWTSTRQPRTSWSRKRSFWRSKRFKSRKIACHGSNRPFDSSKPVNRPLFWSAKQTRPKISNSFARLVRNRKIANKQVGWEPSGSSGNTLSMLVVLPNTKSPRSLPMGTRRWSVNPTNIGSSGGGRIRTHGRLAPSPVFKTENEISQAIDG